MKNFFNLNNIKNIAIIALILAIIIGGSIFLNKNDKLKQQYTLEYNLRNALEDTMKTYQNKEGEWVVEKLTLQADIKDLNDDKLVLTENQKELIRRVEAVNKKNDVLVAANAKLEFSIDSLLQKATSVDTVNHTATFLKDTDSLKYDIRILNIKPFEQKIPTLYIKNFVVPNDLFIDFHWEDSKTHPIAVSVTNSNPMFKTKDIDSYAIPELTPDVVKPTGWKKIGNWFKENGKKVGIFLGGAVIGGLVVGSSG